MPCYDKKLEASRSDFYNSLTNTKDVDCVLTTGEILEIIDEMKIDFLQLDSSDIPKDFTNFNDEGKEMAGSTSNAGSGYFAELIFKDAVSVLFNEKDPSIEYRICRNSDMKEFDHTIDSKKVLRCGKAYGFRNIQNIMRKIKSGTCPYQIIEIQACPSGCLNGGGQIKPSQTVSAKEHIAHVSEKYHQNVQCTDPADNDKVKDLYENIIGSGIFSIKAKELFHTNYHSVVDNEPSQNPLAFGW